MNVDHWQRLEPVFLEFEAAWSGETPPSIDEHLKNVSPTEQPEALVELVMIDFEHRCRRGMCSTLDKYFDAYPTLREDKLVRDDLLRHELEVRGRFEDLPSIQELETRFPGDTDVV
ncbi:MAG: hypothetical protein AB8G99_00100, partial [Planctomycetaceae bacterium]